MYLMLNYLDLYLIKNGSFVIKLLRLPTTTSTMKQIVNHVYALYIYNSIFLAFIICLQLFCYEGNFVHFLMNQIFRSFGQLFVGG